MNSRNRVGESPDLEFTKRWSSARAPADICYPRPITRTQFKKSIIWHLKEDYGMPRQGCEPVEDTLNVSEAAWDDMDIEVSSQEQGERDEAKIEKPLVLEEKPEQYEVDWDALCLYLLRNDGAMPTLPAGYEWHRELSPMNIEGLCDWPEPEGPID
jgi:hypothetical protein